ncbi:MAG: hypothetical protein QCI00_09065 [Candidatus Thermoplasmatota archaeon]|nr:hypothetical protein [Candidatus Thermoplasmatota archaeon]
MYCFECDDFPCESLNRLDRSHKEKYHMSMIKNLRDIKEHGIAAFIKREKEKWTCPICESIICCHNGICFICGYKLILNKTR